MKFLIAAVSVLAVLLTVDGWDLRNQPEEHPPTGEPDLFSGETATSDNQPMKMEKSHHTRKSDKSQCKAKTICILLGGSCVNNATLCSGRLVAEGCKGKHCQCCIQGIIESKLESLDAKLQSFKENMNNMSKTINIKLDTSKGNMNTMDEKMKSFKDDMENMSKTLNRKLDTSKSNMDTMDVKLQSFKDNINNMTKSLNTKLDTSKSNMNTMNEKLKSFKDDMNNMSKSLNTKLDTSKSNMSTMDVKLQSFKDDMNNMSKSLKRKLETSENNLNTIDVKLQSFKDNMNNMSNTLNTKLDTSKSNMNTMDVKLQSFKDNMNSMINTLNTKLDTSKSNMNTMNTQLNSKYDSIKNGTKTILTRLPKGCPDGFFKLSDQCFKLFTDRARSWSASKSKCQDEGLLLAKPFNPLELRSYLVMRYGDKWAWLGGKGTGSSVKWDRDGQTISSSNPMWLRSPSGYTSSSWCLYLMSHESLLKSYPTTPYYMERCGNYRYALCEYLMD